MDIKKKETIYNFFKQYGNDFIGDGSKDAILSILKSNSEADILEILKPITPEWKQRVEELGYFRIITDYRDKHNVKDKNHMEISYMDTQDTRKIPTYRDVKIREKQLNRSPFGM